MPSVYIFALCDSSTQQIKEYLCDSDPDYTNCMENNMLLKQIYKVKAITIEEAIKHSLKMIERIKIIGFKRYAYQYCNVRAIDYRNNNRIGN